MFPTFALCVAVEASKREVCYTEPAYEILDIDATEETILRLGY